MPLFDTNTRQQLEAVFAKLDKPVKLAVFIDEDTCNTCRTAHRLAEEIASLSDNISTECHQCGPRGRRAEELGVERTPAIVVLDGDGADQGIVFYGVPVGHQINAFVKSLVTVSGIKE